MEAPTSKLGLNKKLGPLPAKAWLGIGVVGVIGGLWWRAHLAQQAAATAPGTTDPTLSTPPVNPNIDPNTGLTWAEEAAQNSSMGSSGGGSSGDGNLPTDPSTTGGPWGIDPNTGEPYITEIPQPTVNVAAPAVRGKAHHKNKQHQKGTSKAKTAPKRKSNPPSKPHHTTHHPTPTHRRGHHHR